MTAPTTHATPTVSVVMPMRNAAAFVADSVRSVLDQATADCTVQLVVIDDGSTDDSANIVRDAAQQHPNAHAHCVVLPGPQRGIAAALNAAFDAATGHFLARCDADDLVPPNRLARHAEFLKSPQGQDFLAVCGGFQTVDPKGKLVAHLHEDATPTDITQELHTGHTRTHFGTFLVRQAAIQQLGGARDYFVGTEDVDLQLRIASIGRVYFTPELAYTYRLHHQSSTHTQRSAEREFLTEQARKFARQRAAGQADDLERGVAPPPPKHHPNDNDQALDVAEQIQGMLIGKAWREAAHGRKLRALQKGLAALRARPAALAGYTNLVKLAVLPILRPKQVRDAFRTQHA